MNLDHERLARARAMWRYVGERRPLFALTPKAGQESVWDYPRPPCLAPDWREVVVNAGGLEIARTSRSLRLLETASPPTFYLPAADVRMDLLGEAEGISHCEWKGDAAYASVQLPDGTLFERAAWFYARPLPPYEVLAGRVAFYPTELECFVAGERVRPQPGRFYAGWITDELVGPFKGEPGSGGW